MERSIFQHIDAFLDHMRTQTDPFADRVAERILEDHQIAAFNKIVSKLARNDVSRPLEETEDGYSLPPIVKDYFNDMTPFAFLQEEENRVIIDRGCQLFQIFGPIMTMALAVRSLLKQYAMTKAVKVLHMTTLLEEHINRRILETMQFVLDVMEPGWYLPEKFGIRSIQKLRLIHALIRARIKAGILPDDRKDEKWDPSWGEPINQEDMIMANQTFSIEVLEGLMAAGISLLEQEREDYTRTWVFIGRALGVDPRLEPENYYAGKALQEVIYARNFTLPNEEGPVLASVLVKWLREIFPIPLSEKAVLTLVRVFNAMENDHALRQHLQLPMSESEGLLAGILDGELFWIEKHILLPLLRNRQKRFILARVMDHFLRAVFQAKRGGKDMHFRISDAFLDPWDIDKQSLSTKHGGLPEHLQLMTLLIKLIFGKEKEKGAPGIAAEKRHPVALLVKKKSAASL